MTENEKGDDRQHSKETSSVHEAHVVPAELLERF